jgi:hypothetical protein
LRYENWAQPFLRSQTGPDPQPAGRGFLRGHGFERRIKYVGTQRPTAADFPGSRHFARFKYAEAAFLGLSENWRDCGSAPYNHGRSVILIGFSHGEILALASGESANHYHGMTWSPARVEIGFEDTRTARGGAQNGGSINLPKSTDTARSGAQNVGSINLPKSTD